MTNPMPDQDATRAEIEQLAKLFTWCIRRPNQQYAYTECRYCHQTWWDREEHKLDCILPAARKAFHRIGMRLAAQPPGAPEPEHWEGEILMMIVQRLEALGTDMQGTPPMCYDDAITATVYRWCKRALAGELEMRDGKIVPRVPASGGSTEPDEEARGLRRSSHPHPWQEDAMGNCAECGEGPGFWAHHATPDPSGSESRKHFDYTQAGGSRERAGSGVAASKAGSVAEPAPTSPPAVLEMVGSVVYDDNGIGRIVPEPSAPAPQHGGRPMTLRECVEAEEAAPAPCPVREAAWKVVTAASMRGWHDMEERIAVLASALETPCAGRAGARPPGKWIECVAADYLRMWSVGAAAPEQEELFRVADALDDIVRAGAPRKEG